MMKEKIRSENIFGVILIHRCENLTWLGHGAKNESRIHERTIRPEGIDTTILGSTLKPLVSSSKNRKSPALDAGKGAPFFLLLMTNFQNQDFNIKTLLLFF